MPNELPIDYVKRMALNKSYSIKQEPKRVIITADTIVSIGRRILHKTSIREQAKANLLLLKNRRHSVYTSFCVKSEYLFKQELVKTTLKMKNLSKTEIENYLNSSEWINKAGSYSIQGAAISFFPFISGCYSNVIGLPLPKLLSTLNSIQDKKNAFRDNN